MSRRFLRSVILALTCSITLVIASDKATAQASKPYGQRDGAAEARADLTSGKPLKLYTRVFYGVGFGYKTPGLRNCGSGYASADRAEGRFVLIPEAGPLEGGRMSPEQARRVQAAARFAAQYNQAVFRTRRVEVARLCPKVVPDPKS